MSKDPNRWRLMTRWLLWFQVLIKQAFTLQKDYHIFGCRIFNLQMSITMISLKPLETGSSTWLVLVLQYFQQHLQLLRGLLKAQLQILHRLCIQLQIWLLKTSKQTTSRIIKIIKIAIIKIQIQIQIQTPIPTHNLQLAQLTQTKAIRLIKQHK